MKTNLPAIPLSDWPAFIAERTRRQNNEQPHKTYYSAMLAVGWLPINDMFGVTYRWVHGETWGMIENALAYDYWRLTGRVVDAS